MVGFSCKGIEATGIEPALTEFFIAPIWLASKKRGYFPNVSLTHSQKGWKTILTPLSITSFYGLRLPGLIALVFLRVFPWRSPKRRVSSKIQLLGLMAVFLAAVMLAVAVLVLAPVVDYQSLVCSSIATSVRSRFCLDGGVSSSVAKRCCFISIRPDPRSVEPGKGWEEWRQIAKKLPMVAARHNFVNFISLGVRPIRDKAFLVLLYQEGLNEKDGCFPNKSGQK